MTAGTRTAGVPTNASAPEPLLDLHGLLAGIRWRRRTWMSLALLGLLAGMALAVLAPTGATAVARVLVLHEEEGDQATAMETDVALFQTSRVAGAALQILGSRERPERFLRSYFGEAVAGNVLELTVSGQSGPEALDRAQALADAFIAFHIDRFEAVARTESRALLDRRAQVEAELAEVNTAIAGATGDLARLEALATRRAALGAQVQELGRLAEEASIGAPRVRATQVVDAPRLDSRPPPVAAAINGVVGLVLGLGLGLALASVASVVNDRPVLRRDIAAHLGASVIAQLPGPRRGPARLWRRFRALAERRRVAATLARVVRTTPGGVSLLELGCPDTAAALALGIAAELAPDRTVVVVDDLPARNVTERVAKGAHPFDLVNGSDYTPPRSAAAVSEGHHLGVGSVGPGAAWMDLARLGSATILVVQAGSANTAWLHTVARQLADAEILVIGVVLVRPDPRDRTDGTLWDALHVALRGRAVPPPAPAPAAATAEPIDRPRSRPRTDLVLANGSHPANRAAGVDELPTDKPPPVVPATPFDAAEDR